MAEALHRPPRSSERSRQSYVLSNMCALTWWPVLRNTNTQIVRHIVYTCARSDDLCLISRHIFRARDIYSRESKVRSLSSRSQVGIQGANPLTRRPSGAKVYESHQLLPLEPHGRAVLIAAQDGTNTGTRWPQGRPQECPKEVPRWPQEATKWPQKGPRWSQDDPMRSQDRS